MSRPIEPQKKEELLERCLADAMAVGSLDSSINAIATRIGSSGRMLIYHFGSKQALERQLIGLLETRLREKLWSVRGADLGESGSAEILLAMWQHLTSPELHGLMKLTMELNQRAIQGDLETRGFLERESQQWVNSLSQLTNNEVMAICLFHLFQGAILDFLTTGNSQRGRQTIVAFAENMTPI